MNELLNIIAGAGGSITNMGAGSTITMPLTEPTTATVSRTPKLKSQYDIFDKFTLNEFVVEHRVQEQELIKLKEQNVDYADAIKENLAKNLSRDIVKKISFTKMFEADTFIHSFRGRAWVFTKEELIKLIEDVKNG